MKIFQTAKWIWQNNSDTQNEYCIFYDNFTVLQMQNISINISARDDYALFINERFVDQNQYHDFMDNKAYDNIDISAYIKSGDNSIKILAKAFNTDTASRTIQGKGVIFEIVQNETVILSSSKSTLCKLNLGYSFGDIYKVSPQLGYGFKYSFVSENDNKENLINSVELDFQNIFYKRPIEKMLYNKELFNRIKDNVYGLSKQMSGYICFEIQAEKTTNLTISYGEHLSDGVPRRLIGDRDFSLQFTLKKGLNVFREHFFRIGGMFIELSADSNIIVKEISLFNALYPLSPKKVNLTGRDLDIYNVSINTLINCMHEHYEDCPWREQAQYAMDSRSQILYGYMAFNEFAFPKASLKLMIEKLNADNKLYLTSPSNVDLSINSFSLVYFKMVEEYYNYSGDLTLFLDVKCSMKKVIDSFISDVDKNSLLPKIKGWHFIEWAEGLDDAHNIGGSDINLNEYSLVLNGFFIIALESFANLLKANGEDYKQYLNIADNIKKIANQTFYDAEKGCYATYNRNGKKQVYSEIAQVFAIYSNICDKKTATHLKGLLTSKNNLVQLTLSNMQYKYEVLLKDNVYNDYILNDVREKWGFMLDKGATSFWETLKGEADFDGAGSLCHGWSATPIYVYNKLGLV